MKTNFLKQQFLLHIGDIDTYKGKVLLDPFTVIGVGSSISTNVIAISRITAFCKEYNGYEVEL